MGLGEKVAYLKGLADGLKLDASRDEGRLIYAVIGALESVAMEIDVLRKGQSDLSQLLDAVSDDLADVEELLSSGGEEDADADAEARYAATCPACQETVYFDESVLEDGEIVCPNCGQKLEFDLDALDASEDEDDETSDAPSET